MDAREKAARDYLRQWEYDEGDFAPRPDRWRTPMPRWDRTPTPSEELLHTDSPYVRGSPWNPYRQNVWKGDYPILGQNTFFAFTATSDTVLEARRLPTPSGVSTADPRSDDFFGEGEQFFASSNLGLSFELFSGNTAFRPPDYLLRVTPVLNGSYLGLEENNNVDLDVRQGRSRTDGHIGLQEAFLEKHLADLSANYDFLTATAGIQPFTADFRGLVFSDNNLGVKLTANHDNNRWQGNLAAFWQLEKDTNSDLNTLDARDQLIVAASLFRQDFLTPGYTLQGAFLWNHDEASRHTDDNRVPVRPPLLGDADPHAIDAVYLGLSGDGHIGPINLTHEAFLVVGSDSRNPLAGRPVDIFAQMLFVEVSLDRDWLRPRLSLLWASGDDDPLDGTARGFDSILDNPNVAGGGSSFWIRQGLRLLGVGLVHRFSAYPTLRSSKTEGQANFVNPGLLLLNAGLDADLTAEFRASLNLTHLRFAAPGALEPFLHQEDIDGEIGTEVTLSGFWRPLLTNNLQCAFGLSCFFPGAGFRDIYESGETLFSAFFQFTAVY